MLNMLSNLFKANANSEVAVVKQNGVFSLWQLQSDAVEVFKRAVQSNCVSAIEEQNWTEKINVARQKNQDDFLLSTSLSEVQDRVNKSKNNFNTLVVKYTEEVINRERSLDPESRVNNINKSFTDLFQELNKQQKLPINMMDRFIKQVEIFSTSLKKNSQDTSLRQEIKKNLLHELVDDYHREISQIYLEATSSRRRI